MLRFTAPEFTSVCPLTGQPDFAHIVIDYTPDQWLVESKSLKLYLHFFRNHGAFHEDCTIDIDNRLIERLWRSIKYECVYIRAFETGRQALREIGKWLTCYNTDRPQSRHGILPPDEADAMETTPRKLAA